MHVRVELRREDVNFVNIIQLIVYPSINQSINQSKADIKASI